MCDPGKASYCALLFGHHKLLLETRNRLLSMIGCHGTITLSLRDFQTTLLRHPVKLVVLCQSSSAAERAEAVAFTAHFRPDARVLMLCNPSRWYEPGTDVALLDAMAGHGQFLQAARLMLEPGPVVQA